MIKLKKLLETPDEVELPGVTLFHTDSTARPFTYVYDDKNYKNMHLVIGRAGVTHIDLIRRDKSRTYFYNHAYDGRFWILNRTSHNGESILYKIISFWHYPEDKKRMDKIISDLNKYEKGNIKFDDFVIELKSGNFVSVKDYTGPGSLGVKPGEIRSLYTDKTPEYTYSNLPKENPPLPGETPEEYRFRTVVGEFKR